VYGLRFRKLIKRHGAAVGIGSKGWLLVRPGAIPPGPKRGVQVAPPILGQGARAPKLKNKMVDSKNKMAESKTRWRI